MEYKKRRSFSDLIKYTVNQIIINDSSLHRRELDKIWNESRSLEAETKTSVLAGDKTVLDN